MFDSAATGLIDAGRLATEVGTASELIAPEKVPMHPRLTELFPAGGPAAGSVITIGGVAPNLLTLLLLAQASRDGRWCAVLGMPDLGMVAAADLDIELGSTVLVPQLGPEWEETLGIVLDGIGVVALRNLTSPSALLARRVGVKLRHRGGMLICHGLWPRPDHALTVTDCRWRGLVRGGGRLRTATLDVLARTRHGRTRRAEVVVGGQSEELAAMKRLG